MKYVSTAALIFITLFNGQESCDLERKKDEKPDSTKTEIGFKEVEVDSVETDSSYARPTLGQNFPNPFNPSTVISYKSKKDTRLRVYNLLGEEVSVKNAPASESGKIFLDLSYLPSGIYFYRLDNNPYDSKKLILAK